MVHNVTFLQGVYEINGRINVQFLESFPKTVMNSMGVFNNDFRSVIKITDEMGTPRALMEYVSKISEADKAESEITGG